MLLEGALFEEVLLFGSTEEKLPWENSFIHGKYSSTHSNIFKGDILGIASRNAKSSIMALILLANVKTADL